MLEQPYFCPNCRSNRVKFQLVTTYTQPLMKNAITGAIVETGDTVPVSDAEPTIQCRVCGFAGNEQRFLKQAEKEPRVQTPTTSTLF
ncbi:hypothetical protein [Paenibacillus cymbidii]|uniref:hypothetical protein n=1 Tax=Paenibacillus cymbidii TaxID=1639034 RepID=UPI0010805687|nr:hypothetical protein [Paenibacillus cymbidii]